MNWLAHIYLADLSAPADNREDYVVGNFLGDFLAGIDWKKIYGTNLQQGIKAHFAIDAFTDQHPIVLKSCLSILGEMSKFSTILVDLFYDHFLARLWAEYANMPLQEFVHSFYATLLSRREALPQRLLQILPEMIKEDWLSSYKTPHGIISALSRVSARLSLKNNVNLGIGELISNYGGLEQDFRDFFPEIMEYVRNGFRKP